MRVGRLRVLGSIAASIMLFLLLSTFQKGFMVFEYAPLEVKNALIPINGEISLEVSMILWKHRQLDLIALAFLLFMTAACCSSILRVERGEEN